MEIITLVFTGVVTAATVVYSLLTYRLVTETRLLRESETDPILSVHITPSERYIHIVELVIQNQGRGTAFDIGWDVSPSADELRKFGVHLDGVQLLRGLAQLAPGQRLCTTFGSALELLAEPECPDVTISATFTTVRGKSGSARFVLSPAQLKGMSRTGTHVEEDIADALDRLAKAVSQRRLQVTARVEKREHPPSSVGPQAVTIAPTPRSDSETDAVVEGTENEPAGSNDAQE